MKERCKVPQLAVFDLDGTLLRGNISFFFGLHLYRLGRLSFFSGMRLAWFYWLRTRKLCSLERLHEVSYRELIGAVGSYHSLRCEAESFVETSIQRLLCPEVASYLEFVQSRGCCTALFSSSPLFLVAPAARALQIHHCLGTRYPEDADPLIPWFQQAIGTLSLLDGFAKACALRALAEYSQISLSSTTALSDSEEDLPLLEAAELPVVVRPSHRLRLIARKRGWEEFHLNLDI